MRLERLGVTLSVPSDWSEIAPADLDAYADALVETTGGLVAESYQFGFGRRTSDGFGYPTVLIQIKDTGRVPYGPLLDLPPIHTLRRDSAVNGAAAALSLGPPPYLREVVFRRDRFCLEITSTVPTVTGEPVVALTGAFLTERGALCVHGFDRLAGFATSRATFESVLASVELPPSLRYRPRLDDRWPWLARVVGWRGVLVLLIAAGGGALTYRLLRRSTPANRA